MKLVVFTDLDATLLDPHTYSWKAAQPALQILWAQEAPIVLVSSKTIAEMEPLNCELAPEDPFVIENGGGIVVRRESPVAHDLESQGTLCEPQQSGDLLTFPMGKPYGELVRILHQMSVMLSCELRGFSALSDSQVASLTGLPLEDAAKARMRSFDEPFVLPEEARGKTNEIEGAAASLGVIAIQGGRFWHLIGHDGKGRAVASLIESYRRLFGNIVTVGLGDSPNDFPFLEIVDIPVILGAAKQRLIIPRSLDRARRTSLLGPEGWKEAMLDIIAREDVRESL
jgi:mannosyl-3-phosphoglycerate phosphatase